MDMRKTTHRLCRIENSCNRSHRQSILSMRGRILWESQRCVSILRTGWQDNGKCLDRGRNLKAYKVKNQPKKPQLVSRSSGSVGFVGDVLSSSFGGEGGEEAEVGHAERVFHFRESKPAFGSYDSRVGAVWLKCSRSVHNVRSSDSV